MARGKPIGQGQGHLAITRANSNNFVMDHSMVCIAGAEPVERIGINIKSQNRRVKDGSVIGSNTHKRCVVFISNRTRGRLCWRKGCIFGTGLNFSGRRKIHTSRRKDDFSIRRKRGRAHGAAGPRVGQFIREIDAHSLGRCAIAAVQQHVPDALPAGHTPFAQRQGHRACRGVDIARTHQRDFLRRAHARPGRRQDKQAGQNQAPLSHRRAVL